MWFQSCEIEGDNFRASQGKQIRTKNKESFESKVLKQKQLCVAVAVAVAVVVKRPKNCTALVSRYVVENYETFLLFYQTILACFICCRIANSNGVRVIHLAGLAGEVFFLI